MLLFNLHVCCDSQCSSSTAIMRRLLHLEQSLHDLAAQQQKLTLRHRL